MNEQFAYLVEKYLDHSLNEKEKAEFEKQLLDPACAEYLKKAEKAERIIEEGFRRLHAKALKKEPLKSVPDDLDKEIEEDILKYGSNISPETREKVRLMHQNMLNRRKRILWTTYGTAAAAVITVVLMLFATNQRYTPRELSKKYYKQYEYTTFRGILDSNIQYNVAISLYNSKKYSQSAKICREILSAETTKPEFHFLYGLNLMALDSMQSAIKQFSFQSSSPLEKEASIYLPAHWYKSLCYLALGKADSALIELNKLKEVDSTLAKESEVESLYKALGKQ